MGSKYKHYQKQFEENVRNVKTDLKNIGMLQNARYVFSKKDNSRIEELERELNEARKEIMLGHNHNHGKVIRLQQDLENAKQNARDNAKKGQQFDIKHVIKVFKGIGESLKQYNSIEELKEVEKEVRKFEKKIYKFSEDFASKRKAQLILKRFFDLKNLKESEYRKQVAAAIALMYQFCRKTRNYIKCMKIRDAWKPVTMRHGKANIFKIANPIEAVRTGDFAFLVPFMGGKEPLMVRQTVDKHGQKVFEFDRNFATRIKGVKLHIVVDQFCDYFKDEINKGCYMKFDFRDKRDLFNICEELAKRNVKLNLEKTDLPEKDKYRLVRIYIRNLKKGGFKTRFNPKTKKQEDFISRSELRKARVKVRITPKLQEYIWDKEKVRISGGQELTLKQKHSSMAQITMPDYVNNPTVSSGH
ncbi:MAG: hypothetical protein PVI75_05120 [Gammaproteobacteria bacterium]|jgi:hypothetical protein